MNGVTVFILAGGRSTRMGRDKALLVLEGKTLLERALETARDVAGEVAIVGARERYAEFGVNVVEDEFQQCGPLGGIHAALGASHTELNVILSVDTPLVSAGFLRYLLKRAQAQPDALATVPDADGGVQGTCAVYRRPLRAVAEQQLKKGKYKIAETLALVRVEYVEENEMREAGFDPAMFANLNTPEEFARAGETKAK
ncbi:MAG TPA: molybdenum cofactor guanylyltransferase [Candidatus Koribacter sp.]